MDGTQEAGRDRPAWLYVVVSTDHDQVKIGLTTDPEARLASHAKDGFARCEWLSYELPLHMVQDAERLALDALRARGQSPAAGHEYFPLSTTLSPADMVAIGRDAWMQAASLSLRHPGRRGGVRHVMRSEIILREVAAGPRNYAQLGEAIGTDDNGTASALSHLYATRGDRAVCSIPQPNGTPGGWIYVAWADATPDQRRAHLAWRSRWQRMSGEQFAAFAQAHHWQEATTDREVAPHAYLLRKYARSDAEFVLAARCIQREGDDVTWRGHVYRYLRSGDWVFWVMEDDPAEAVLINRAHHSTLLS